MDSRFSSKMNAPDSRGQALLEFAVFLPFLLVLILGTIELSGFLSRKIVLTHTAREAASYLSRGADFQETIDAIIQSDGILDLDGPWGRIILTEVNLDGAGAPVVVQQMAMGGLNKESAVGNLPPGQNEAPATLPNGMTLLPGVDLWVVELFSRQDVLPGDLNIGEFGPVDLYSLAAF
jgi:hypothetical protein